MAEQTVCDMCGKVIEGENVPAGPQTPATYTIKVSKTFWADEENVETETIHQVDACEVCGKRIAAAVTDTAIALSGQ